MMARHDPAVWLPYCVIAGALTLTVLASKGCTTASPAQQVETQTAPTAQEAGTLTPAQEPIMGEDTVITGTWTPNKRKDSPVKTERISGDMLNQAGATNIGQSLQDVPGIQPGR